jgi:hypothetical protein
MTKKYKITKDDAEVSGIRKTTRIYVTAENSKGEEIELIREDWVRDDEDGSFENDSNILNKSWNVMTYEKLEEFFGDDVDDVIDDINDLDLDEDNEDMAMLERENKCMAEALLKLGYSQEQITDICNGKDIIK